MTVPLALAAGFPLFEESAAQLRLDASRKGGPPLSRDAPIGTDSVRHGRGGNLSSSAAWQSRPNREAREQSPGENLPKDTRSFHFFLPSTRDGTAEVGTGDQPSGLSVPKLGPPDQPRSYRSATPMSGLEPRNETPSRETPASTGENTPQQKKKKNHQKKTKSAGRRQLGRRVLFGRGDQSPPAGRHRHEDDPHRQEHAQHDRQQGHLGGPGRATAIAAW